MGLTHPQYLVMVALWQHGEQSVKDLGALLVLDSGTLSPLLKRLEAAGLVRRRRDATDERQVLASCTPRGERLREDAEAVHDSVVRQLGLTAMELESLRGVLSRVVEATSRSAPGLTHLEGAAARR